MNRKHVKQMLAGLSIAGLVAGVGLMGTGCASKAHSSCGGKKSGQSGCHGEKSKGSCSGEKSGGSCSGSKM